MRDTKDLPTAKEPIGEGEVFWSDGGKQIRIFGEETTLRGPPAVLERVAMRVLHLVDGHGPYGTEAEDACTHCEAVRRARQRALGDSALKAKLSDAFGRFETLGFRVAKVWLPQAIVSDLSPEYFDRETNRPILEKIGNVGYLWGAMVFVSDQVPSNHIAILPEGFEGTLVDGAGSMPL